MSSNKNTILITLVVLLAVGILFETVYIIGTHSQQKAGYAPVELSHVQKVPKQAPTIPLRVWSDRPSFFDDSSMAAQEWEPFREMERIQQQMNRMFRDSFEKAARDNGASLESKSFFEPEADIKQTDTAYVLKMDIPGLDKDQITVDIKGNVLTVSGERKKEVNDQEKGGVVRQEREFGYFSKSMLLPQDAQEEGIKASYDKGVLAVTIPRTQANKAPEKQTVKVSVL
jgi:HSP20 family protein